jgi:hypothetical protein
MLETIIVLILILVGAIVMSRIKKHFAKNRSLQDRAGQRAVEAAQLTWEPTAVSQYLEILVYVKRGKTSILIGKTDITAEDFDTQVENLTVLAEKRAMELNSMGIKWDGDLGSMVPAEVANRTAEERDRNAKRIKELESLIHDMTQPEGLSLAVREYLKRVSPHTDLGTLRLVNNGHVLVELPPVHPVTRMGR